MYLRVYQTQDDAGEGIDGISVPDGPNGPVEADAGAGHGSGMNEMEEEDDEEYQNSTDTVRNKGTLLLRDVNNSKEKESNGVLLLTSSYYNTRILKNTQEEPAPATPIRKEHVMQVVAEKSVGVRYFSKRRWRKTVEWKIPDGVCAPGMEGMVFRNTRKGDVESSTPLAVPELTDARYKSHHRRQQKGYSLLKKMLVDKEGNIYRPTNEEIEEGLAGTDEADGVRGLTGAEYKYSVEVMFQRRR